MEKKTKKEKNDSDKNFFYNAITEDPHGKLFHYEGWRVEDDGKSVIIKVATDDDTRGKIFLPWKEIEHIRQFGWERQEEAAEEKMRGKRVHCRHLFSFHAFMPECCQIGLDNGPHDVNCLTCQYIDGYIEEYDPDSEIKQAKIDWENMKIIDIK